MTTHKNLMTLCVAAVFAVGLAACGGGGNGDGDGPDAGMDDTDTGMDDTDTGMDDTDTGMDDTDTGMDDTDTGPTDPPPTPVAVNVDDVTEGFDVEDGMVVVPAGDTMSYGDIDFTCDDGGDACTVMVTNNDDDTVSIMSTGGMVTAQDSRAYLESQLAAIERETETARDKADRDERIDREGAVRTAISTKRVVSTTQEPLPLPATASHGVSEVGVERAVDGTVTVDVNGDADDVYTGGETTAGSGDWTSVTMTKTNSDANDTTDTLVIYTDIEEPADEPFNEQYVRAVRDNILMPPTSNVPSDDQAAHRKKAASDEFPSGPSQTLLYGDETGNPGSFAGMFDGVPGTYECTASGTCTLTTNDDGELNEAGDWRFSPNNNLATVKDPDTAYTYFGWWLNKPEDSDDPHDTDVFASGTTGHSADVDVAIEGTATYSGQAAGKYVTRTFSAGVQTDAGVGHFTADANLTARFGDETALGDGIKGSVTGFDLDDGSSPSWRVILENAAFVDGDSDFGGTTEVDFGGGATENADGDTHPGNWQGTFYGAGEEDEDAPGTVVGTFDAVDADENAAVLGAFGATKQ